MRRLLLFLVVFGAGSGVLWHFESKRRADEAARSEQKAQRDDREAPGGPGAPAGPPAPHGPGATAPSTAPPEGPGPDPSANGAGEPAEDGAKPETFQVLRGYLSVTWPGDGERPHLTAEFSDLEPQDQRGTRYVAQGISLTSRVVLPDGTSAVRETVVAKSGVVPLEHEPNGFKPKGLSPIEPVELVDVQVVRHREAAFVPLELRAPRLRAWPGLSKFESLEDDVVEVEGPGLSGSGRRLVFEDASERLVLGRGAHLRLRLEDGREVEFWTTGAGPLELVRVSEQPDTFEASAEGGARLELLGEPPATLDAESIVVRLTSLPSGDLAIEEARARGAVVVTQGTDRYTGDSARVTSPGGELANVVLNQSPAARVTLQDENGEDLDVIVEGDGPLVVDVVRLADDRRRATFVFQGPGDVQVPERDLAIHFEDRVDGRAREDEGRGVFVAAGGVVATRGDARIETESLTATVIGDSTAEVVEALLAVTEGPTVMTGKAEDGSDLRVDAVGGLTARLVDAEAGEGRWLLDRASDVTVLALGDDPFRVTAGVVRDGDLAARTFRADGDVRYEAPLGEATATRGMVRGAQRVELSGDPERPARVALAPDPTRFERALPDAALAPLGSARAGELVAVNLVLTEATLDADGAARGFLETVEGRLELDADHVRVTRLAPTPGGTADEPVTLVADGVRRAELLGEASIYRVTAGRVEVDGVVEVRPRLDGPAGELDRTLRVTDLGANGAVVLAMRTVDGQLELDADDVRLERGTSEGPDTFHLTSHRVVQATLEQPSRTVSASCLDLDVRGRFVGEALQRLGSVLVASGDVWVEMTGRQSLEGRCGRLELVDGERAVLEPAAGQRVTASGLLPVRSAEGRGVPYSLFADRIVHEPDLVEAVAPELALDDAGAAIRLLTGALLESAIAGRLRATPTEIVLDGGLNAIARTSDGRRMELNCGRLTGKPAEPLQVPRLRDEAGGAAIEAGAPRDGDAEAVEREPKARPVAFVAQDDERTRAPAGEPRQEVPISDLELSGGVVMRFLDGSMAVRAESVSASGGTLRLVGWPDQPAVLEYGGFTIEASWITFDTAEYLVAAGRGILRSPPGPDEWTLGFAAIEPRVQGDESLVIVSAPRLTRGRDEMRADWLSVWLLRDAWRAMGAAAMYGKGDAPPPPPPAFAERDIPGPDLLAEALLELQQKQFAAYVRALYAEGSIEVNQGGSRASRADALYLDVGEASGWLSEAELVQRVEAGSRSELVRIRAGRLETDGSGRLVAERATLTTCDHDNPHYVVLTQQLALEPRPDGRWRFGARGNRLRFANGLQVPLPSIGNAVLDERGDFEGFENEEGEVTPLNSLTIAQTARFGASIGASFGFETGKLGRWVASLFGMDTNLLRGRWDTDARWLGDRGPLVSAKLDLRERKPRDEVGEDFRVQFYVSGIPDRGQDRGVQRVGEDDREEERIFGWVRGRYPIVRHEWIDFAFSGQTDPGVQAEFFEGDFLKFDERDTFVRWRKAQNGNYFTVGASKRVDSFRTDVEELPSLGAYFGQREVAAFGPTSLLYGGSVDVANLRRREGDLGRDPFSEVPGGAGLGLDGREVLRGRIDQRLDLAIPTGWAGVRSVPFLEMDATGWTENQSEEDDVSRFALLGGMELGTALHSSAGGFTNVLAPRLGARTDLAYETQGGAPTPFDRVERPIDGDVVEAGLRGLWTEPGTFENLDLDVSVQHTADREGFEDTTELGLLGEWITRVGGDAEGRVGLRHDGRYDVEDGDTNYSRSTVAWSPRDDFLIEGRYGRARGADELGLFEVAGVDARWKLDPKWELELRQTWSLAGEGSLDSGVTIRRFSHDFLLEFDVSRRAGEGGTSFGISFNPLLAWKRPRLGLLDRR